MPQSLTDFLCDPATHPATGLHPISYPSMTDVFNHGPFQNHFYRNALYPLT
jgi:hypothetical protein